MLVSDCIESTIVRKEISLVVDIEIWLWTYAQHMELRIMIDKFSPKIIKISHILSGKLRLSERM